MSDFILYLYYELLIDFYGGTLTFFGQMDIFGGYTYIYMAVLSTCVFTYDDVMGSTMVTFRCCDSCIYFLGINFFYVFYFINYGEGI